MHTPSVRGGLWKTLEKRILPSAWRYLEIAFVVNMEVTSDQGRWRHSADRAALHCWGGKWRPQRSGGSRPQTTSPWFTVKDGRERSAGPPKWVSGRIGDVQKGADTCGSEEAVASGWSCWVWSDCHPCGCVQLSTWTWGLSWGMVKAADSRLVVIPARGIVKVLERS